MKVILSILAIFIFFIAIIGIGAIGSYNGFGSGAQSVDQQWAQVQNVYQRRADLVPNLVATVSGAASFEKSTLTAVTEARASVGKVNMQMPSGTAPVDPQQLAKFDAAQGQLGSALSRLLVVSERYPDLKATTSFRDLQAQLEGTENRITVERGRFNGVVKSNDPSIDRFPAILCAR